jgi:hypothetical protein
LFPGRNATWRSMKSAERFPRIEDENTTQKETRQAQRLSGS